MREIEYPNQASEVEILAQLWHRLREADIDIHLGLPQGRNFNLDAVVFKEEKAVCIIECKSDLIHELHSQKKRRLDAQVAKYQKAFGLPIIVCGNSSMDMLRTIAKVKELAG